jgi:hypothetical protein
MSSAYTPLKIVPQVLHFNISIGIFIPSSSTFSIR